MLSFDTSTRASLNSLARGWRGKKLRDIAQSADDLLKQIIGSDAGVRDQLRRLNQGQFADGGVPLDALTMIYSRIEHDVLLALIEPPRGPNAGPTPRRDAVELLCQRCWEVEQLRNWAAIAAKNLPSDASGAHKKAQNFQWLVGQLDSILFKHTNRHITRSYKAPELKDYVKTCFNIADSTIGSGSIDGAMKAYIGLKTASGEIADDNRT